MTTNSRVQTIGQRLGWPLVILLILILVAFAIKRSIDTYSGISHEALFELRYLDHPVVTALHMLSGVLFILLGPFQFIGKIRAKNLVLHRRLGRLLVVCALITGFYGLIAIVALPSFGGLPSETGAWFFGVLFIFAIVRAFWCVRNKNIAAHREWMIRAFALGLGVGMQRVVLIFFMASAGPENMASVFEQSFGPSLWLGFCINLLIAETWINLTRKR